MADEWEEAMPTPRFPYRHQSRDDKRRLAEAERDKQREAEAKAQAELEAIDTETLIQLCDADPMLKIVLQRLLESTTNICKVLKGGS